MQKFFFDMKDGVPMRDRVGIDFKGNLEAIEHCKELAQQGRLSQRALSGPRRKNGEARTRTRSRDRCRSAGSGARPDGTQCTDLEPWPGRGSLRRGLFPVFQNLDYLIGALVSDVSVASLIAGSRSMTDHAPLGRFSH
jgi:hypothetical protein